MMRGKYSKEKSMFFLLSTVWLFYSTFFGMKNIIYSNQDSEDGQPPLSSISLSLSSSSSAASASRQKLDLINQKESDSIASLSTEDTGTTSHVEKTMVTINPHSTLQDESGVRSFSSSTYFKYRPMDEVTEVLCERFKIQDPTSSISCEQPKNRASRRRQREKPTLPKFTLDRIYYINLEKRFRRRAMMESWLSQQSIPYERVVASIGQPDICVTRYEGQKCMGVSGLARTNVHITEHFNTTGITLVLEDDIKVQEMDKLIASIHLVPADWDVIRWDCWDAPLPGFQPIPFGFKAGPLSEAHCTPDQQCWYCGGTHAVLWKGGDSVEKLRKIWSIQPHLDIDCLLTDPSLNSYCVQVGIGQFQLPESELTDINPPQQQPVG